MISPSLLAAIDPIKMHLAAIDLGSNSFGFGRAAPLTGWPVSLHRNCSRHLLAWMGS